MDSPSFLHAAHQVRNAFDGLRLVSWLVIGFAVGALALTWGRLLSWLRAPDVEGPPRLVSWREEGDGFVFQVSGGDGMRWSLETSLGETLPLRAVEDGTLGCGTLAGAPVALITSGGDRLTL